MGLTKIEATTRSLLDIACLTSDKWPSCKAPMVGTKPTFMEDTKDFRKARKDFTVEYRCGPAFSADAVAMIFDRTVD